MERVYHQVWAHDDTEPLGGPMTTESKHWRFTADDYERMIEAGILTENDRVELLDGQIVAKSAITHGHAACVRRLTRVFAPLMDDRATVSIQNPVRLSQYSEPEPDVALLTYREDMYSQAYPTALDVLVLIEVADTTLAYDRNVKLPMYARAEIPEVWIIDLVGETIERYTEPTADGFRIVRRYRRDDAIEPARLPGIVIQVDDVLPR